MWQKKETKKYLIFTPPSHSIISPLEAINIDVPKSGWDKTKIIGIIIKVNEKETSKDGIGVDIYNLIKLSL